MNKIFITFLFLIVSLVSIISTAQTSYYDAATMSALVELNKTEFQDKSKSLQKQSYIEVATSVLKGENKKMNDLHKKLDARLNSVFILLADADLVANVVLQTTQAYKYQKMSVELAANNLALSIVVVKYNAEIAKRIEKMISFFALIVGSYSEISKMEPDKRKKIYREVYMQMYLCKIHSESMYYAVKGSNLKSLLKKTMISNYINQDKAAVNTVLESIKNF